MLFVGLVPYETKPPDRLAWKSTEYSFSITTSELFSAIRERERGFEFAC
jgi:hypothetical protein